MTMRRRSVQSGLFALAMITAAGMAAPTPVRADIPFNPTMVSDVAEKVTPAVVNITTRKARTSIPRNGNPFHEFFGPRRRMPQMGAGSGVVISANGDIVTNNHVVDGADEITVTFSDRREFEAKLVGSDEASDLAFLKIEARKLPYLRFGDSKGLRLGEFVLAVGNPFGVGQTVTMGIVSAKGRANMGIVEYEDFIQTDASINPGNSGGALVNLRGELVGINTAILSRSGGAQGIGFAVPANMVIPIRDQIMKDGRVRRGWLGVAIQDLTPALAKSLSLNNIKGVLVSDVMKGGPAARGNLEPRDVIIQLDGNPTRTSAELRNRVALTRPGSRVKLSVVRDGRSKELTVTLAEKKDDNARASGRSESEDLAAGLAVQELDGRLRRQLRIPSRIQGVVVVDVASGSPAARAGLQQGDVIVAVDRKPINSVEDLERALPADGKDAFLRVFKRGMYQFLVLKR